MSSVLHTTLDTQRREIRLLALLPGECTDPVSCQLHIDSLDREPLYEALSYVWGDSNEHRTILLDETEFPVTDNLYAALRRLRNRREKRVIWVDQLCINQSDLVERGHQVGLMESVYSKTFRALFWLADIPHAGPGLGLHYLPSLPPYSWMDLETGNPSQPLAARFFDKDGEENSSRAWKLHKAFLTLQELSKNAHIMDISVLEMDRNNAEILKNLVLLLDEVIEHKWWARVWTLQECVLPPHGLLIIGPFSLPWNTVLAAAIFLGKHLQTCCEDILLSASITWQAPVKTFITSLEKIERLRNKRVVNARGPNATDLIRYITDFSMREASDPRDKVFGLLGLITDWEGGERVRPDYVLPLGKVFTEITGALIESTGFLDILPFDSQQVGDIATPSWVPDFRIPEAPGAGDALRRKQMENYVKFLDGGGRARRIGSSALKVTGKYISEVTWTSPSVCGSEETRTTVFSVWWTEYNTAIPEGSFLNHDASQFLRLLCGHTLPFRDDVRSIHHSPYEVVPVELARWYLEREPRLFENAFSELPNLNQVPSGDVSAVDFIINATTRMRRLFQDSKPRYGIPPYESFLFFGLGPASIAKGDKLYYISGSKMPVVLRPVRQRDLPGIGTRSCYEYIGTIYHEDQFTQRTTIGAGDLGDVLFLV